MSNNIENALHAVRKNGKWYVSGSNGANIIKANSKAELPDPSTVAEGTIALVPSPVIVLSDATTASILSGECAMLTTDEQAAFEAAAQNESSVTVKIAMEGATIMTFICSYMNESSPSYIGSTPSASFGAGVITYFGIAVVRFSQNGEIWNAEFGIAPIISEE